MQIEKRQIIRRATIGALVLLVVLAVLWFAYALSNAFQADYGGGVRSNTVGAIRNSQLDKITAEYEAENPQGQILVVNGDRLAPLHYLNQELKSRKATWRVRVVDDRIKFQEVA